MNSRNYFGFMITISLMFALGQQFEWSSSEEDSYEGTPMLSKLFKILNTIWFHDWFQRFIVDAYSTRTNTFLNDSYISRCARICFATVIWRLNLGNLNNICSCVLDENYCQLFSCLDILPDDCEEISDEEDIVHKPYPTCCPIYCKLKKRMERVKSSFIRSRLPPSAFET